MKKNDFMVTTPTLQPEDKPNTAMIKMLITLAIIGGIGWFVYKNVQDGSFEKFLDSIVESIEETDSEPTSYEQKKIEDYLSERYGDDCKYDGEAPLALPNGAKGGLFKCFMVSDVDVLAYVTDGGNGIFSDGYLYAKYYNFTKQAATSAVKLYFPKAEVELTSSMYEISSGFNEDIAFNDFVKKNEFEYTFKVSLPRGTSINSGYLITISRQIASVLPNYRLEAVYVPGIEDDPINTTDNVPVFTMRSKNGNASVSVNR